LRLTVQQSKTNMANLTFLDSCLACGDTALEPALNLGQQPLANNFKSTPESNEYYPLAVNRCTHCSHLQLTHVVDPAEIYRDYSYVSGTSQTYLDYMTWFAKWCREYSKHWHGTVLDIGCNDGSQLDMFKALGFRTAGVDPAENIHPTSTAKGHAVVCGFWDQASIDQLTDKSYDIIVAQNSFAHNPDPVRYLKLLAPLMREDSLFFIQTSQADMVRNGEFDTIYHEHVNFFNINSMNELCRRAGVHLIDAVKTPIHGTSYVFVVSAYKKRSEHIANLIAQEADLLESATYKEWAGRARSIVSDFASRIHMFRDQGYSIVGYGAAAKGMTLLNYAKVDLDFIIDDNPLKQNTYSPGRDIPVVSSNHLKLYNDERILFVPLAWNVFDELKAKIKAARDNADDKFLKYFPEVTVEN
jgi:2-polyprenyl-3-methyl-5-hydroxy-6-metoxy-1,4-benzoquinol methylase